MLLCMTVPTPKLWGIPLLGARVLTVHLFLGPPLHRPVNVAAPAAFMQKKSQQRFYFSSPPSSAVIASIFTARKGLPPPFVDVSSRILCTREIFAFHIFDVLREKIPTGIRTYDLDRCKSLSRVPTEPPGLPLYQEL